MLSSPWQDPLALSDPAPGSLRQSSHSYVRAAYKGSSIPVHVAQVDGELAVYVSFWPDSLASSH